ncbi:MAG: hypothetical protein ACKVQB_04635 [Bacteroidia bacterium]
MNKFLFIPFLITFLISGSLSSAQKGKDIKITQYEDCKSIKGIDFDSIRKNTTSHSSITLIILRAESSHSDGTKTITSLDSFINPYDTNLIHISSYELKYTKGSSSCEFNYSVNGKKGNVTKGNPPFLCLTTQDDSLLSFIKRTLNLSYYSKSDKYLLLSERYNTDKGFYKQLNKILYRYDQSFLNSYEIYNLKKHPKKETLRKNYISLLSSISSLNQVSKSGIKSGDIHMKDIKLGSVQLNFNRYFKNITDLGFLLGGAYSKFNAYLGINNSAILIDTLTRNAIDKDGDSYSRIAYGKGIEEIINLEYLSLMAGFSYKIPWNTSNSITHFTLSSGLKISNIISSSYQATSGSMTWAGYYPQYDSSNTMFANEYGFFKNQPVYQEKKPLEVKSIFMSGFMSIDWDIALHKSNLFFKTSLFGEAGTTIINSYKKNAQLAYSIGDHNSLAYRSDKLKINSWGLKFGINYGF